MRNKIFVGKLYSDFDTKLTIPMNDSLSKFSNLHQLIIFSTHILRTNKSIYDIRYICFDPC